MKTLDEKLVLITGSGHGLGLETARTFARQGATVLISDRDPQRVAEAVGELCQEGLAAFGYAMDVSRVEDVRAVRDRIVAEHGPIDVLINNAGIVSGGSFLEVPLEKHLTTFAVNTHGPVIVTHVFLPDLAARSEAHIVNISSASAFVSLPHATTYAASKWAVLGFTDSLREELQQLGLTHVGVTAICPSYISTGMFHGVKPPLLTPLLTPERLAGSILRCVQRRRDQLLTPFMVNLIPLAKATWPRFLFRRLLSFLGVYRSMSHWQGHLPKLDPSSLVNSENQNARAAG